MLAFGAYKTTF